MYKYPALALFLTVSLSCEVTESINIQGGSSPRNNPPYDVTSDRYWNASALPLELHVSDNLNALLTGGDYDGNGLSIYQQMMKKWDDATPTVDLFNLNTAFNTTNKEYASLDDYYDGENGIYISYNWYSELSSSALAIAQYYRSFKNIGTANEYQEIVHADILVNYRDHDFNLDEADDSSYDLPTVLLHEIGHVVGMQHQSDWMIPAVMNDSLGVMEDKRSLYPDDISSIQHLYPGGASSSLTGKSIKSAAVSNNPDEEVIYRGIIELRSNGDCIHTENGKVIKKHKVTF